MRTSPGPVTAADVDEVVDGLVTVLSERLAWDWRVPAERSEWDCWEAVEHIGDSLFFYATQLVPVPPAIKGDSYPYDYRSTRPGGPEGIMFARRDAGTAGLLRVLNACGGLLASMVRTAAPTARARHMWGPSDPEGFAAMGVVEVLAHWHDIAGPLQLVWAPPEALCDRTLNRLFPDAPADADRARTLLWVTGRGELPGLPRLEDWRWYGQPR